MMPRCSTFCSVVVADKAQRALLDVPLDGLDGILLGDLVLRVHPVRNLDGVVLLVEHMVSYIGAIG